MYRHSHLRHKLYCCQHRRRQIGKGQNQTRVRDRQLRVTHYAQRGPICRASDAIITSKAVLCAQSPPMRRDACQPPHLLVSTHVDPLVTMAVATNTRTFFTTSARRNTCLQCGEQGAMRTKTHHHAQHRSQTNLATSSR
jgi:hypothetical protein